MDLGHHHWQEREEPEDFNFADHETYVKLQEEQQEVEKTKTELEALLADNERNLMQARKAVALAARDRGWGGTVQQRQPKATSTFPFKSKGKGKFGGKFNDKSNYYEGASWNKGKFGGKFGGKSKGKFAKGKPNSKWHRQTWNFSTPRVAAPGQHQLRAPHIRNFNLQSLSLILALRQQPEEVRLSRICVRP